MFLRHLYFINSGTPSVYTYTCICICTCICMLICLSLRHLYFINVSALIGRDTDMSTLAVPLLYLRILI